MIASAEAYGLTFQFPAGDIAVGAALRDHGEFAKPEIDFLLDHAPGSGSFLDVGANIGAIGLPFAKARPEWRVLAIEAHQGLAQLLTTNASSNGLTNVQVFNVAAGARSGTAEYPAYGLDQHGNYGDIGFHRDAPTRTIGMAALDDLAPPDTRLIKIDVQGFEPQVLAGAKALRRDIRPIWIVEAWTATDAVASILRDDGYDLYWFYSPFVTHHARVKPAQPTKGDTSIVALPRGAENRWDLTPVDPASVNRPTETRYFPYLRRYGYEQSR
jgi:FkbM family methyltransferase